MLRHRNIQLNSGGALFDLSVINEPVFGATPLAAYRFFDHSGDVASIPDYYGNEDLSVVGGTPNISDGYIDFQKSNNEYLEGSSTTYFESLHDGSDFVLAFTFIDLPEYQSGNHYLFGTSSNDRGVRIQFSSGTMRLYSYAGGSDSTPIVKFSGDGNAHTVVMHMDRTNRDLYVYIDGVFFKTDLNHNPVDEAGGSDYPINVGRYPTGVYSNVQLLDLRFYSGVGAIGADAKQYHAWASLNGLLAASFNAAYAARDYATFEAVYARQAVEASIRAILDADTNTDYGMTAKSSTGNYFYYAKGVKGPDSVQSTNSCQKPITIAAMLNQVDKGNVTLSDTMLTHVAGWDTNATGAQRDVDLEHCVTYQAGFNYALARQEGTWADIATDVGLMPTYEASVRTPGAQFEYLTGMLDMAGALVVAAHPTATNYEDIVDEFFADSGLFGAIGTPEGTAAAAFQPFTSPDIAPSDVVDVTTNQYIEFLEAFRADTILNASLRTLMTTDQMPHITERTTIWNDITEDWHWGAGFWRESRATNYNASAADRTVTIGSGGQFGVLPDTKSYCAYIGFVSGPNGAYAGCYIARSIEDLLETWGTMP